MTGSKIVGPPVWASVASSGTGTGSAAQRLRAQDLAVEGLLSATELRERLVRLQEERSTLEREAARLRSRREALADLEAEAESVMERYAAMVPEGLERFTPEDRHEPTGRCGSRSP